MINIRASCGISSSDPREVIDKLGVKYKFCSRHQYGESFIFWCVSDHNIELPSVIEGINFHEWDASPLNYIGRGLDLGSANKILAEMNKNPAGLE